MSRPVSKDAILDAAEAIVVESGASRMTLDAVAERTGISKGGLMYSFPSKDALIEGMINRMSARLEGFREEARQRLPGDHVNELMIEIRTMQAMVESDNRPSAALLAVVANQPELVDGMHKDLQDRFFNKITRKDDFVRSSILFFAAMGIHFHKLLNISILDDEMQSRIFQELIRLAGCDSAI